MGKEATKRQKELLAIIYKHIKDTGYPPTFEEMRESLGVSSNQSVVDLLYKLEKQGVIKKNESSARGIAILPVGYDLLGKPFLAPFLGVTSAGAPAETIEISGEWQAIPSHTERLERLKDNVFLLKVRGDSMINAGIEDNDVVLVQEQDMFSSGDIVLAQIKEESTIKRFISQDKPPYKYLKPENPRYENIILKDDTYFAGKIISVLKNGHWKAIK